VKAPAPPEGKSTACPDARGPAGRVLRECAGDRDFFPDRRAATFPRHPAPIRRGADRPHAAEADRTAEFPWASFAPAGDGAPSLGIPEAYGGAGADMVTQAIALEELARVCASTSLAIIISKPACCR